jgi:ribosome-associated protein
MTKRQITSFELVQHITEALQNKKGKDIAILNLKKIKHAITDYFVVVSATSDTQVDSLRENVEKELSQSTGIRPVSAEGRQNKQWVILDYFDVVVHIFLKDTRTHYGLEELWGDAEIINIEDQ